MGAVNLKQTQRQVNKMVALVRLTKITKDDVEKQPVVAPSNGGAGNPGLESKKGAVGAGAIFICFQIALALSVIFCLFGISTITYWSQAAAKGILLNADNVNILESKLCILDSDSKTYRSNTDDFLDNLNSNLFDVRMDMRGIRSEASVADMNLRRELYEKVSDIREESVLKHKTTNALLMLMAASVDKLRAEQGHVEPTATEGFVAEEETAELVDEEDVAEATTGR